jgi:hypothetical protein
LAGGEGSSPMPGVDRARTSRATRRVPHPCSRLVTSRRSRDGCGIASLAAAAPRPAVIAATRRSTTFGVAHVNDSAERDDRAGHELGDLRGGSGHGAAVPEAAEREREGADVLDQRTAVLTARSTTSRATSPWWPSTCVPCPVRRSPSIALGTQGWSRTLKAACRRSPTDTSSSPWQTPSPANRLLTRAEAPPRDT